MEETDQSVRAFVEAVASPVRRRDAETLLELFERITGEPPRMWGPTIVGFGRYHYRYATGHEGDSCAAGFSPRKAATSIYLPDGVAAHAEGLARLGEHTTGVGCLYLKNLDNVDLGVLEDILTSSWLTVSSEAFGRPAADASPEN